MPYCPFRLYCQLLVSGKHMQRFLQFRLGCHGLPIAADCWRAAHVVRADRLCTSCDAGAIGDEQHMIFECTALAPLRQTYAELFTDGTDSMMAYFAQQDHRRVFHFIVDCVDFMGQLMHLLFLPFFAGRSL